ncbi:MAG: hypothetical protein JSV91_15515 [Phycisphaerales bacterium]|nr:MAG: hypothetical protein JSV91_15515 [Phycisphaerales bacterium]
MTTVWRKKAYEMFGFEPGSYSYAHGKVDLFADLLEMARRAARTGDSAMLDRVFEYVGWADKQIAENLRSSADITFFIPMFSDDELLREASKRLSPAVLEAKRALALETAD